MLSISTDAHLHEIGKLLHTTNLLTMAVTAGREYGIVNLIVAIQILSQLYELEFV